MCNLSRKSFLHKVLLEKITKPETGIEIVFSFIHWFSFLHKQLALVLIVNSSAKSTLHHIKPRTMIPKSFFINLQSQFSQFLFAKSTGTVLAHCLWFLKNLSSLFEVWHSFYAQKGTCVKNFCFFIKKQINTY